MIVFSKEEGVMPYAMSVVSGFCFGVGMILAAAAMKVVFHFSICG